MRKAIGTGDCLIHSLMAGPVPHTDPAFLVTPTLQLGLLHLLDSVSAIQRPVTKPPDSSRNLIKSIPIN